MGLQSLNIARANFQDNFDNFCSSAGGFYQVTNAIWYTEKKKPIGKGSSDTKRYFSRRVQ